jgi:Na+/proline symporter
VDQHKSAALLKFCFWSNKWLLIAGVIPRLCLIAFTFSQPFLLARVIDHQKDPDSSQAARTWDVIAYVVVYVGIAVSLFLPIAYRIRVAVNARFSFQPGLTCISPPNSSL